MTESGMSFDPNAMSARLEELTETLCGFDFLAREPETMDDPALALEVSSGVTGTIFGLPLAALPTVIMFIVSQLNYARNQAASVMVDNGLHADVITEVASKLAAQDADSGLVLELLDIADILRKTAQSSPYVPVEEN